VLRWNDKHKSYRALVVVLHTLRDWLPINESADLAAQLPTTCAAFIMSSGGPRLCPRRNARRPISSPG
jgi:uncharacterized protein (DUF2267 family)